MLAKKHRINKEFFKEILKRGKSCHLETISLKILSPVDKGPFFTFVVSKKTAKKAVSRNKLKRQGRYIIKKHLNSFKKGMAIIIFFKKGSETMIFFDLEEKMLQLFKKAKVITF